MRSDFFFLLFFVYREPTRCSVYLGENVTIIIVIYLLHFIRWHSVGFHATQTFFCTSNYRFLNLCAFNIVNYNMKFYFGIVDFEYVVWGDVIQLYVFCFFEFVFIPDSSHFIYGLYYYFYFPCKVINIRLLFSNCYLFEM